MRILVLAASARAAAQSLRRAGHRVVAADLFGDADLRAVCDETLVVHDWPHGLDAFADRHRNLPLVYGGGLENHPDLLARWGHGRPGGDWCSPAAAVRRVRRPERLAALLPGGLAAPPRAGDDAPHGWLCKPVASAGGVGVVRWNGGPVPPTHRLQPFAPGVAHSATFVATASSVRLFGFTRQLTAADLGGDSFLYAGNIGPLDPGRLRGPLVRLGRNLHGAGLRGVFGIDLMLAGDAATVLEVNPRYTAAAEVLELARGRGVYGGRGPRRSAAVVGKAVVYATADGRCRRAGPQPPFDPWRLPERADVPDDGAPVSAGQPVCTVFADGSHAAAVLDRLRVRVAAVSLAVG